MPVLALCSLAILLFEGAPILYVSTRRVFGSQSIRLGKFRVMVRNADKVVNRETVPVEATRFLNIPRDSLLYTRTGRIIERLCLTELPQFLHVLNGDMSLIGNRPLPENVIQSLKECYPYVEDRFLTKGGLTGPVQLIGRDDLSDEDRLSLEIAYCQACFRSYSMYLDFIILLYTVLIALGLMKPRTVPQVQRMLRKWTIPEAVERSLSEGDIAIRHEKG